MTGSLGCCQSFLARSQCTGPFLAVVRVADQLFTVVRRFIILILPVRPIERTVPKRRSGIQQYAGFEAFTDCGSGTAEVFCRSCSRKNICSIIQFAYNVIHAIIKVRTPRNLIVCYIRVHLFRDERTRAKCLQYTEMIVCFQEITFGFILRLVIFGHSGRLQFIYQTQEMMYITQPVVTGRPDVHVITSPTVIVRR